MLWRKKFIFKKTRVEEDREREMYERWLINSNMALNRFFKIETFSSLKN